MNKKVLATFAAMLISLSTVQAQSEDDLRAIRFTMSPYKEQEWMKNVPLYGVEESF